MKKLQKFLNIAIPIIIAGIALSFFYDVKIILILVFSGLLIEGYMVYKEKMGKRIIVAFLFAIIITAYYMYEYTTSNFMIGRINLFPLVAWTFGLVLLREIYERIKGTHKFWIVSSIYIIFLVLVEYLGYHFLNIRLNSDFPGLFGLDLMHSPIAMKIFYLLIGPLYLKITDYLEIN